MVERLLEHHSNGQERLSSYQKLKKDERYSADKTTNATRANPSCSRGVGDGRLDVFL